MNQQPDIGQTRRTARRAPKTATRDLEQVEAVHHSAELHPAVLVISLATYAVMMAVYWMLFYGRVDSAFMVAVSTGFLIAYATTPLVMIKVGKVRSSGDSFSAFLNGRMTTHTGTMGGWEVLVQVITIPVALTLATMGIGLAIINSM